MFDREKKILATCALISLGFNGLLLALIIMWCLKHV